MSSLTQAVANALSFANLRGLASASQASSAAKADGGSDDDDDKRKRKDNETDGDYAARMKAMDDDDSDSDKKKDDDAKASASIATVRESAHAAGVLEGAAAERSRCAAIFASPAAAGNIELTAELAFNTDMTPEQASGVMAKSKSGGVQAASVARFARNPNVGVGAATELSSAAATAQLLDKAFGRVNPQRKR